jgi:hypothetical protein
MINHKDEILLGVFFVLMLLSIYIRSLQHDKLLEAKVPQNGCPGTGTGKLHKWTTNLTDGGSICTICNKVPGSFNGED